MGQHISTAYEDELAQLTLVVQRMGRIACEMVEESLRALERRDASAAERVVAEDGDLDRLEANLETLATRVIALRQPVAADLRRVVGAMRIVHDLERAGDLAAGIAKRAIALGDLPGPDAMLAETRKLGEMARSLLGRALAAHRAGDVERARAVWADDARLDGACAGLFDALLSHLAEDPRSIRFGMHAAFCIRNVERIGDHATNIAETVIFIATGEPVPAERPKGPPLL